MQGEFKLKHTAFVNKSNSLVQGSRIIIYPLLSTYGDEIDGYAERFYDDGTVKESFMMDAPIKGNLLFFENDFMVISTDEGLKIKVDVGEIKDFALLVE